MSFSFHHITARRTRLPALVLLALSLAGCSTAIPLPGFISREDVINSIAHFSSPLSPRLDGEDERRALAALSVALDPAGSGAPVNWDNPASGLKGAFTPLGEAFAREQRLCRAFRAEIGTEERVDGLGCRTLAGDWAVIETKPSKRG